jgi:hypothetical protein
VKRRSSTCLAIAAALATLTGAGAAGATTERRHALVIGYNGSPAVTEGTPPEPLKFADDDALAFFEWERELGDDAVLLSVVDADTRRRYPQLADLAGPPTLAGLDESVARLRAAMDADLRASVTPVFIFYYSGHGARDKDGQASLTLLDGGLSRRVLYERVLDHLPARIMHLLVDACHAEAVVRVRDAEAGAVVLSPKDVQDYLSQTTLARYPHAGLVIASSSDTESHEWDFYQSGVFTHEIMSGLRGAADVNGDGRVEYSELSAFLGAANNDVQDPRARLHTIVQPPETAVHAPLADLGQTPGTTARLAGISSSAGHFFIEDERGIRLADGHAELGHQVSLTLPADRLLFVRSGDREVSLLLKGGESRSFGALAFQPAAVHHRGAVESSLRAGLFTTPFGPAFYAGYVGRTDAVAVTFASTSESEQRAPSSPLRWVLGTTAGALAASSLVFGGLSWGALHDFQEASTQRAAHDANTRFQWDTGLAIGFLATGAVFATAAYFLGAHGAR